MDHSRHPTPPPLLAAVAVALLVATCSAPQGSLAAPAVQSSPTRGADRQQDRPPIVVAPGEVSVEKDQVIEIKVTASDPDGDPITSLTADVSHLPPENHATFKTNAAHTVGTLRWRTTFLDFRVAPYVVTFTAKNALSGSATTSIAIEDLVLMRSRRPPPRRREQQGSVMPRHARFAAAAVAVLLTAPFPALAQAPSGVQVSDSSAAPRSALTTPPSPATGPDFPRGAISGHAFIDYYYDVAGDPRHAYNASGSDSGLTDLSAAATAPGGPKNIGRDLNGIVIRRVYFQLDNDLTFKYATRFRLEVDSKSLASDGKIGVAVKAAYLKVRSAIRRGDFSFGMLDTPTWYESEDFWQYRSIEKTLADFRGIGTRADLGVALKGYIDSQHQLGYFAMLGNGTGQRPENNRYKKYYLSLPLRLGDLHVDPYVDYESVPGSQDKATYMLFAGYEFRRFAVGVEALDRVNHHPAGGNQEPAGVSIFARGNATATVGAFARFDQWVPDRRATNRVDSQLWIAGLDWRPLKDVHVMPNVEATQYHEMGSTVAPGYHDLQARLTFYYLFSKPQS